MRAYASTASLSIAPEPAADRGPRGSGPTENRRFSGPGWTVKLDLPGFQALKRSPTVFYEISGDFRDSLRRVVLARSWVGAPRDRSCARREALGRMSYRAVREGRV